MSRILNWLGWYEWYLRMEMGYTSDGKMTGWYHTAGIWDNYRKADEDNKKLHFVQEVWVRFKPATQQGGKE